MSIIYFSICTLFLVSTISALRAPPVIYSAVIQNAQNTPIQCNIKWLKPEKDSLESQLFTVEKYKDVLTNEKLIDMGTWKARATIEEIRCGKLVLTAPFEGVTSPTINWHFVVEHDKIKSVGSN
jgi:hypothetical protein